MRVLVERLRSHRGLYWAAVLASLVMLAFGGVIAYLGYTATAGPDGAVRGYFAALERGDAAGALAFGDLPDGPHTLLTDTVLRDQQRIAPIRHVQVVSVQRSGDTATVTLHYTIAFPDGPQPVTDQVPVYRHGSSWYLVRTAVPTTIELTHALDRATIVGAGIPAGQTLMFPGAVPIDFDTPYLQLTPASAVTFGTGRQLQVGVQVSAAGRTAVLQTLDKDLKACVASGGKGYCPLPSDRYVPGSLDGQLVGAPGDNVSLSVDPSSDGTIDIAGTIGFRGRYGKLDFDNLAATHYGTIQLPLDAVAYAVKPVTIQWAAAS